MGNNVAKSIGQSVLTTGAKGALTGALSGGGLAGAASGATSAIAGMGGGAVGALGGAAQAALAAMGPIGWAVLAGGAIAALTGQDKSRLDKIKEAYKKGQKTGDMSLFEKRMEKFPKAAQRFLKKHPELAGAQGQQPGAGGPPGMIGNQMDFWQQQVAPQVMSTPSMFARPEAADFYQKMMAISQPQQGQPAPPGQGQPAPGAGMIPPPELHGEFPMQMFAQGGKNNPFAAIVGGKQPPGPAPDLASIMARYGGIFGNGGGQLGTGMSRGSLLPEQTRMQMPPWALS